MADFAIAERGKSRFKDFCLNLGILGKKAKVVCFEGRQYVENLIKVIL